MTIYPKPKRDLDAWMTKHRFNGPTLAKELGLNPATVWCWMPKNRKPGYKPYASNLESFDRLIVDIEGKSAFKAIEFFK